jgi:hypothetical protein
VYQVKIALSYSPQDAAGQIWDVLTRGEIILHSIRAKNQAEKMPYALITNNANRMISINITTQGL